MKQFLAIENNDGEGEYQLVFSAKDMDDAQFLADHHFYAELCGEITETSVPKKR